MEREFGDPDGLLRAMDALVDASTAVEVVGEVEAETRLGEKEHSGVGVELSVSGVPHGRFSAGQQRTVRSESRLLRMGVERHRVLFGPLSRALRAVTKAMRPSRLWLLLDEWSSLPLDLQPLLADLLRRSVLPVPGITVKIAAIERRSRFFLPTGSDYLGIEVGSDAASAVSLDDFMISTTPRTGPRSSSASCSTTTPGPGWPPWCGNRPPTPTRSSARPSAAGRSPSSCGPPRACRGTPSTSPPWPPSTPTPTHRDRRRAQRGQGLVSAGQAERPRRQRTGPADAPAAGR